MSEVEMRLERDEFVVDYDSNQISEDELIAIVKKPGYAASIVANTESSAPVDGDSGSRDDPIFIEALARAKKENKPLVLDFYADWCAPCLKMLKTTIPDPKVASLLEECVFLKIDTDKHPELAKSFGVVGLPGIRFVAPDGTEKKRLRDYMDAESFAAELKALLASLERKAGNAFGVETRPPTAEEIQSFELPSIKRHAQGRVLSAVVENGPAAKAGLMLGGIACCGKNQMHRLGLASKARFLPWPTESLGDGGRDFRSSIGKTTDGPFGSDLAGDGNVINSRIQEV